MPDALTVTTNSVEALKKHLLSLLKDRGIHGVKAMTNISLHLMAIFQVNRCSLKQRMMEVVVTTGASISRAKIRSNHQHQPTNQHPVFYRPDALPVAQPCQSIEGKYHIPWTCLPQAHLGVFQLVFDH